MTGVCVAREKLGDYLEDLAEASAKLNVTKTVNQLDKSAAALATSTTTLLLLGAALVFAPVAIGKGWTSSILWMLAAITAAVAAHLYLEPTALALAPQGDDNAECMIALALLGSCAMLVGSVAMFVSSMSLFALGAVGGGFGMYEFIVAIEPSLHKEGVEMDSTLRHGVIAVSALILGVYFACAGDALLDTISGLLGSLMIANGVLSLLMGTGAAEPMHISKYRSWYIAGTMMLLMIVQSSLMNRRRFKPPKAIIMQ